ncbi:G-protein coupled receptor 98 [Holothuria leucospilota]|uniref:G-protein coupled receptor 98 n=1 Tax=Holothuria leucospilota TaxID=206669 RepID=A0A9Q1BBP1_HOLLE|nr:G-protein coupled receptor 98 [Holothuria leucospilota]
MTYLIEFIFTILLLILHQETGAQVTPVDQPVKGLATKIPNTTVPLVYMANTSITVGEIGLYYVPITILRSEAVPYGSYVFLDLDLSYDDRRYAYLQNTSPYISAYSTNITTNLYVDERSDMFFTQPSIFNVSIYSCDYDCNVGLPRSTIIFVKPERNVTLSFYNDYWYGAECDCDGCCYDYIEIRSSRELSENMVITLLTGSNDTAIYNVDYSFDKQFVEAQPAMNLSTYSQYHYTGIYIKRDGLLEGTEYFHLRFDNASLPDRVFVASPAELTFEIRDGDYGFIRINDSYRHVSEDVQGTVDLIVETNIIQPDKNLTLSKYHSISLIQSFYLSSPFVNVDVTMGYGYYSYYSESATPGEDYVPFDGFYVIPPGASSIVIPITIIDDDLAESEETFSFQVEAYYEGTDNYYSDGGSIYIEDDETRNTPLLFSFDTKSVTVNESSGTLEVYVTANIKNEGYVYLQYIPSEENGLLEYQDYTAYFNLTIKQEVFQFDKDTEYKIEVNILNDCDIEMTEMMVLNISAVSIGQTDPENYNLTIIVEDNDAEGDLNCLETCLDVCHSCYTLLFAACSCGSGVWPTEKPTSEPEPEPLMFNFELNEFEIYEGECSFHDIDVVATRPTNATVFLGIQPWELEYGEDFTISAKKLVFENNDRQNFSFRALQDTLDEDIESVLISIAYASDGMIGRRNAILVHVFNEKVTESEANSRSARSIDGSSLEETRSEEFKSTAITTGLVAGLVSSLLVVMVTTILFGAAVVMRKPKQSLKS